MVTPVLHYKYIVILAIQRVPANRLEPELFFF